jgi:hypothetical protein
VADKNFKVKTGLDLPQPLPVSQGGTGQTSTTNTLNSLLPTQTDNASKILSTDGSSTSWVDAPRGIKSGNTASRPSSPANGDLYYNTETSGLEVFDGGWWIPNTKPAIPTSLVATNQGTGRAYNNGQASIAFSSGTNSGKVSTYTVYSNPGGFTNTGSSSPIVVTGLQSGVSYTFAAYAEGAFGSSSDSLSSSAITATTIPQAPTIGAATAGNNQVSVAFTPGATGGSSITEYAVTSSPGNFTGTGSSSPIIVTGLTNGTSYTFTVTATNANGTSIASSATSSVTAGIPPFNAELLIVGGGGGGGYAHYGAGGGGGGFRYIGTNTITPATMYSITVGSGGTINTAGVSSSALTYSAAGGGYGGTGDQTGGNGGSGGGGGGSGGAGRFYGGSGNTPSTSPSQGNGGGYGYSQSQRGAGGGGGGAGASGGNASQQLGGNGGSGSNSYSTWATATSSGANSGYYAGGGGGAVYGDFPSTNGSGGAGGGGAGGKSGAGGYNAVNGTANTGGGGGGNGASSTTGSGGSGIVIIRTSDTVITASSYTGTLYTTGGYKYYKFTSTGSITF